MDWEQKKAAIFQACEAVLEPHSFKFISSRPGFEKKSKSDRRGVYLILTRTNHGNYVGHIWCGIRNNIIHEIFHRTSGIGKAYQSCHTHTLVNLRPVDDNRWLNTEDELNQFIIGIESFLKDHGLSFLEKEYSYQNYSDLLNSNPSTPCLFHGNREFRCHYGLITAKLAGDSRYDVLKEIYSEFLTKTNNGFYYPPFQKLISDLESTPT
jgi:hypothetical protein